eukprot:CAMPEP_0185724774 /NCGR_PEP_ID=MMETSP1171-20130828/1161_1 /TAXON_ID=374046 /ORGANISM="Helicotheca tamensis, Strain CCMP826" /LENGTH=351 /DNA_ID=CAMNT_0028392705 /DNA_START=44 /DNA_END=1099 /DNA_ORIENTATION=+
MEGPKIATILIPLLLLLLLTSTSALTTPTSKSSNLMNRYKFLSSSAATAFLGSSFIVLSTDPESCSAATEMNNKKKGIPTEIAVPAKERYLDYELEMKYGDGPDGNPRSRGVFVRRFTGDATPFSFPVSPVSLVKEWPEKPPFAKEDFFRADENDDGSFYTVPRFVYHIDEPAVASLTQYYRNNIPKKSDVLDICSSWVSHYPLEFTNTMGRISGTGMNALELIANDQLTDYKATDLNVEPKLPYDDASFDVVTCVVSIDYLIHPIEVLKEINRVLRPGGKVIISQSNRCFPSKAISMWLQMNDRQHLELINAYFQYAGGFEPRKAFDITADVPKNPYNDPMFIVEAVKKA